MQRACERHGIEPGELELELTESTLMADTEAARRTAAALREIGVALVIDDFGTGYSSLAYLKQLRPDKLKIDRSFVRDLPGDADDRALTQAILRMAQALYLNVVAEGVETPEQRQFLEDNGCPLLQGFLLGHAAARRRVRGAAAPRLKASAAGQPQWAVSRSAGKSRLARRSKSARYSAANSDAAHSAPRGATTGAGIATWRRTRVMGVAPKRIMLRIYGLTRIPQPAVAH